MAPTLYSRPTGCTEWLHSSCKVCLEGVLYSRRVAYGDSLRTRAAVLTMINIGCKGSTVSVVDLIESLLEIGQKIHTCILDVPSSSVAVPGHCKRTSDQTRDLFRSKITGRKSLDGLLLESVLSICCKSLTCGLCQAQHDSDDGKGHVSSSRDRPAQVSMYYGICQQAGCH